MTRRWKPTQSYTAYGRLVTEATKNIVNMPSAKGLELCKSLSPPIDESIARNSGPRDARLFYSSLGAPMMLYNSPGTKESGLCRHEYLIDLRDTYDALNKEIGLQFLGPKHSSASGSIGLVGDKKTLLEYNWEPFVIANDPNIYFVTSLSPLRVGTFDFGKFSFEMIVSQTEESCLSKLLNGTLYGADVRTELASPLIEVFLGNRETRGKGLSSVLVGLVKTMHKSWDTREMYWETRVVTMEAKRPFNFISISKPLSLIGIDHNWIVNPVSIAILPRVNVSHAQELSMGYLDDQLIINYGLLVGQGLYTCIDLIDVLKKQHYMCM